MEGELQHDLCFDSLERKPELRPKLRFAGNLDVLCELSRPWLHRMTRWTHKVHERLVREGERPSERLLKKEIKELVKNDKAIRYLDAQFAAQLFGLEIPGSLNALAESSCLHDEPLASANEAAVDYDDSSSFNFLMSLILGVSSIVLCLLPLLSTNKKFTESLHFAKAGPLNSMRVLAGALMMAAVTSLLALDALPRRPMFARRSGFVAVLFSVFAFALFLPAFFLGAMFALI